MYGAARAYLVEYFAYFYVLFPVGLSFQKKKNLNFLYLQFGLTIPNRYKIRFHKNLNKLDVKKTIKKKKLNSNRILMKTSKSNFQ